MASRDVIIRGGENVPGVEIEACRAGIRRRRCAGVQKSKLRELLRQRPNRLS